jgi:hypothetical protein
MKKMVELVFRAYKTKEDEIQRGVISEENIEWVSDHLMLEYLSNEELSEMWKAVDDYFTKIRLDKTGENWRTDIPTKEFSFYSDTMSAWLDVINREARIRKAKGEL